jgi:hypothetical protein
MKVTITVHYAGQKQSFTGVEFDDDITWEDIYHDFVNNVLVDSLTNEATGEELE